jgi:hypothetical protein
MVQEEVVDKVPYCVAKQVPYTVKVKVAEVVKKEVPYTVTRCVPKCVEKKIQVQCCQPCNGCGHGLRLFGHSCCN